MEVGQIVHYVPGALGGVISTPYKQRRCIPAVVTRQWKPTLVNLVVLCDGANDLQINNVPNPLPIRWESSVAEGATSLLTTPDVVAPEFHQLENCPDRS